MHNHRYIICGFQVILCFTFLVVGDAWCHSFARAGATLTSLFLGAFFSLLFPHPKAGLSKAINAKEGEENQRRFYWRNGNKNKLRMPSCKFSKCVNVSTSLYWHKKFQEGNQFAILFRDNPTMIASERNIHFNFIIVSELSVKCCAVDSY